MPCVELLVISGAARSERLSGRKPEYRLIDESELLLTIYAASNTNHT
jgi:hypothetical protein